MNTGGHRSRNVASAPGLARELGLVLLFASGAVFLGVAFAIFWAEWWGPPGDRSDLVSWVLLAGLGVSAGALTTSAVLSEGRARWLAFCMVAALLLGFSALTIVSIGILIAPLGFMLLVVSAMRLRSVARQPPR